MKKLVWALALLSVSCTAGAISDQDKELDAWKRQAQNVTIIRDDWGIAHVYGKTDADAVFGVMYAQAEDDFNRVETNYLNSIGRLAESAGESEIYRDLRMKLFIDPEDMKAKYAASPAWLKALMNAYADGLNYYLATHPEVTPLVIKHFEPWMALTFTEGSIGGDIERVNLNELEAFYGKTPQTDRSSSPVRRSPATAAPFARLRQGYPPSLAYKTASDGEAGGAQVVRDQTRETTLARDAGTAAEGLVEFAEPSGSNGVAIAPSNTASHHALLLINPHTSFFFRSEAQMVSDEGLNAYGALTWGQFFVYQGFNDRAGWMHTSSGVDNIDEYLETVVKKGGGFYYKYGSEERPLKASTIVVPYKTSSGMAQKEFTVYRTHHGPIVRAVNGKWVSVRLMQEPVKALMQSYTRTKATNYKAYRETMELHTNSSNNTVYADADGTIAYFHSNFIPKRDTKFDWTRPVDGSDPATEWNGVLSIDETPGLLNPPNGWLYNTNNWPWSAAGANSPKKEAYPAYVERNGENWRGVHAIRVLQNKKDFTLSSFLAAAFDSYLPAFDRLIPVLVSTWDRTPAVSPLKATVSEQIALLRAWDFRWNVNSVPTALAVYWGQQIASENMRRRVTDEARKAELDPDEYIVTKATPEQLLEALKAASEKLAADFGSWKTPWGEINRFQRLTGDIVQPFDDRAPSIPVGFTSSRWGSLASFGARTTPPTRTKKIYGASGNSFVAVVEFGDRVQAKAVSAGGESGNPSSRHFNDQATRYATGDLRDVYFYREQLKGHTEREYHPGQ
ncbi:MAG TPA: penicillin acylase family protein [Vicinamibacterales bacterium]|nr:penicillin acylase family protein [Vicinamibacterales bacterium]